MQSPFRFLENLFEKSDVVISSDNQFKGYFIIIKYLSQYAVTFTVAVKAANLFAKLPEWAMGCLLYHTVKERVPPFIEYYLKKPKLGTTQAIQFKEEAIVEKIEEEEKETMKKGLVLPSN